MVTRIAMSRVKITTGCARHSWAPIVLGGGNSPPIQAPNNQEWAGSELCALTGAALASANRTAAAIGMVRRAVQRMQGPRAGIWGRASGGHDRAGAIQ